MKPSQIFVALLLAGLTLPSVANDACRVTLQAGDSLTFDRDEIQIPADCKTATVVLQHTGRLPVAASGHNWVLTTSADLERVARDGYRAGASQGWLQPNDPRVLAHIPVTGRNETAEVTIDMRSLDPQQRYGFVCTVGGHSPRMRGTFKIVSTTQPQAATPTRPTPPAAKPTPEPLTSTPNT